MSRRRNKMPDRVIYKTTNIINNKIYVGQDSYNDTYYLGSGTLLKRAVQKYGKENFLKEIIDSAKNQDELNEKELFWIIKLDSTNKDIGYNLLKGAKNSGIFCGGIPWNKGKKTPPEVIKKLRESHLGNKASEETKKLMSSIRKSKNFKHSDETKKKIAESKIGNTNTRGKSMSEESKNKMRIAATGRTHTPETRLKLAQASRNRTGIKYKKQKN